MDRAGLNLKKDSREMYLKSMVDNCCVESHKKRDSFNRSNLFFKYKSNCVELCISFDRMTSSYLNSDLLENYLYL